jgi:Protein-tyrosine-phosphatase-like, N-terminal domain
MTQGSVHGRGADPLTALRNQLSEEYGEIASPEAIEQVARQSLGELQGARVKEFVPLFAWRRARQRLAASR